MILNFSMFPIGKKESLSDEVAKVIEIVEDGGLPYKLHSMGTVIEGEWEEVMELVKRCRDRLMDDSNRIYCTITIDDRKGATGAMERKVASVESQLGYPVSK